MNNRMISELYSIGLIPVIKIENADDAVPLAKALIDGGLPAAEITFRTPCAAEAIKRITDAYPEMLVGAGTVLTTEQVDKAIDAGAQFIVTPGFDPEIVKYCVDKNIPIYPGCTTPTDYHAGYKFGLPVVKFFPAEACGGLNAIKAMSAPYGGVKFMPTGGISEKNINEYLAFPKIHACGGSWMVKGDMVAAGEFDKIKEMTAEAVALVKEIRG